MKVNQLKRNRTFFLFWSAIACLSLSLGCEKTYEPNSYRAAPRVEPGQAANSGSTGQASRPDITNWISPEAVRANNPNFRGNAGTRGYSGMRSYRGDGTRGYAGFNNAYRGYAGQSRGNAYRGYASGQRAYRGMRQSNPYRGYGNQRNYRGSR